MDIFVATCEMGEVSKRQVESMGGTTPTVPNNQGYDPKAIIVEGHAKIYKQGVVGKVDPKQAGDKKQQREGGPKDAHTLFYNPAQVLNRDLSLVAIKVFAQRRVAGCFKRFDQAPNKVKIGQEVKGLTICEPLAATGLRSLRYVLELPRSVFRSVTTGDIDPNAVAGAEANRKLNGIPDSAMEIVCADANELMHAGRFISKQLQEFSADGSPAPKRWDIVDLDPYGTAAPFLEAGIKAVKDGGMLCVTSTDMPVLGGNSPDVAFYKYGGTTVKARYLHEMALRLVLHQINITAGKCRRYVQPLLSLSVDFYVRVFVQIWDKPVKCAELCSNTAVVYQCANCDYFHAQPFGQYIERPPATGERPAKRRRRNASSAPDPSPAAGGSGENSTATEGTPPTTADVTMDESNTGTGDNKKDDGESVPNEAVDESSPASPTAELPRAWSFQRDAGSGAGKAKFQLGRVKHAISSRCPECESVIQIAGPFYAGPLHDPDFVAKCLKELEIANSPKPDLLVQVQKEELLRSAELHREIQEGNCAPPILESSRSETTVASVSETDQEESQAHGICRPVRQSGSLVLPELDWVFKAEERFDYEMTIWRFTGLSKHVNGKLKGILIACQEELPDIPLFYKVSSLFNQAHVSMMKLDKFKSALLHLGYRIGLFHREPLSIKTDAPADVIFDVMRAWIAKQKAKLGDQAGTQFARVPANFLAPLRNPNLKIDFTYHPTLIKGPGGGKANAKCGKWLPNPTTHWGPGRRAGR